MVSRGRKVNRGPGEGQDGRENARLARVATPRHTTPNLQARHFLTATSRLHRKRSNGWHWHWHHNATQRYTSPTPDHCSISNKRTTGPHLPSTLQTLEILKTQLSTLPCARVELPASRGLGKPSWLGAGSKSRAGRSRYPRKAPSPLRLQSGTTVQVYNSGSSAPGLNYRAEALEGRQPLPEDDLCTAEASSVASRTRNPRFEARNSIEPCFRWPSLHTALRGGRGSPTKLQMPVKLHPGAEVHSDANTATLALSGTIQKSGSIISMNPQKGTSTPVQNGQGRWRPGHGKVVKIVHSQGLQHHHPLKRDRRTHASQNAGGCWMVDGKRFGPLPACAEALVWWWERSWVVERESAR